MNETMKAMLAEWWPDLVIATGAAAIAYGAGLVYAPAGWITGGVLLLVGGVLGSRR